MKAETLQCDPFGRKLPFVDIVVIMAAFQSVLYVGLLLGLVLPKFSIFLYPIGSFNQLIHSPKHNQCLQKIGPTQGI